MNLYYAPSATSFPGLATSNVRSLLPLREVWPVGRQGELADGLLPATDAAGAASRKLSAKAITLRSKAKMAQKYITIAQDFCPPHGG